MVTTRAIITGLICSFIIGAGEPFAVLFIQGSALCADYSAGGAVFLFFILVFVVNALLKKVVPRFCLKPPELITVYIMMIVACAIPSWGFTMNLIGLLAGIFYYATPANRWEEVIHPYLPSHLFPHNRDAIWQVYEGLPKGMKIPWDAWVVPLSNWFLFIVVFYFMSICLMVMLRRQWVEQERLTYPLTELPVAMVQEKTPLYRSRLMWIGFLIPFVIYSMRGFSIIFPLVPAPQLGFTMSIFNRAFSISFRIFFEVIGLAFFMSTNVLLSIWLFALFFIVETGFLGRIGFSIGPVQPFSDPAPQVVALQSLGALLVLSVSCLWFARGHLKKIYYRSIGRLKSHEGEKDEILSYRTSFWGFIFCFLFVVWWINRTGIRMLPAAFFAVMAVLIFLGIARIIAQAGLAYYRAPVIPAVPTLDLFGSRYLGNAGLAGLGMTFAWATDIRTLVMASVANGLKMSTEFKINCRRLLFGIMGAIIISLVSSAWITLFLGYRYGGINLQSWQFSGLARFSMGWVSNFMNYPVGFGKAQMGFLLLGGGMMFLLITARNFLLWWPISPVGLAVGMVYPIYYTWFSIFIAWMIKALIMKYGGIKVYNKTKEFFLGMVLGSFVTAGIWILVGFFTKVPGLRFTLG